MTNNRYLKLSDLPVGGGGGTDLGWINVKDHGALGDGENDDTAGIQAALNAVPVTGGVVYFPPGKYLSVNGGIEVNKRTTIIGCGGIIPFTPANMGVHAITSIVCSSPTADLFVVNEDGCMFKDLALFNSTGATAGSGIKFNKSVGAALQSCAVYYFYDNWNFINGWDWGIDGCINFGAVRYGMKIADVILPDAGDQSISNSWFYSSNPTCTLLKYVSGGGLKIVNTKFNGAAGYYGTAIDISISAKTNLFFFANNSIENCLDYAIKVTPEVSAGGLVITGNEIVSLGYCIYLKGIDETPGNPEVGITSVNIVGNTLGADASKPLLYARNVSHLLTSGNNFGLGNIIYDIAQSDVIELQRSNKSISINPASPIYDLNKSNYQTITLDRDVALPIPQYFSGEKYFLSVVQDGIGGHNISFPGGYNVGTSQIDLDPGAISYVLFHQNIVTVFTSKINNVSFYANDIGYITNKVLTDFQIGNATKGLVLRAMSGQLYRYSADLDGSLIITAIPEP